MDRTTEARQPSADSDNVTALSAGDKRYYLIGTAHVSSESVAEVGRVIEQLRPDTVCIELCPARYSALTDENRWRKLDIFKVIREGKTLFLLANLAIAGYQRRLGQELGVKPGAEMLAAARKAEQLGARVELVDRDIHVTLKRTWRNVRFTRKLVLLGGVVQSLFTRHEVDADQIEQLKQKAQLSEMMAEFAEALPDVKLPLIDERDQYLMSGVEAAPGDTVVAVVGAAHVEGMRGYFQKPVDREALDRIPPPSRWTHALKWLIPALLLAAFSYGYFKSRGQSLEQMLYAWILPNSVASALLTVVAGGKLLSVITAFVASPITSLNPLLGAGMVVGLTEAWLRKPTVHDAERINEDVRSVRGVYRNPFTRVMLVAVLANVGSALGAWIGISWVLALLP